MDPLSIKHNTPIACRRSFHGMEKPLLLYILNTA
jgi:hypothetical protein